MSAPTQHEPAPTKPGAVVFSDQDILAALRRHARADRRLPRKLYESVRSAAEPSAHLFELRFGTWNAALRRAGLKVQPRSIKRAAIPPTWSERDMVRALRDAQRSCGSSTVRSYDAWRKALPNPDAVPSPQTIRARFGSWAAATAAAFCTAVLPDDEHANDAIEANCADTDECRERSITQTIRGWLTD